MIHKDYQRIIDISRKYNLKPDNTIKSEVFILFDEGHSPGEVRLIVEALKSSYKNPKTFTDTIRRYYYTWRKAQGHK